MKGKGWVKLHRSILAKGWLKNHNLLVFWIYCILKATHKPITLMVGFQQVHLQAGQFIFGRKKAAKKTGLSERTIRTCLKFLEKNGSVTIKPTNKYSIITIVNWRKYQSNRLRGDQQNDQQATSERPHTRNTKKREKNLRFAHRPQVGGILSFWDQAFREKYGIPYSGDSKKDRRLIKKLLKHHSAERLKKLGQSFFHSPDPLIQKSDHSITSFYSQLRTLMGRKKKP